MSTESFRPSVTHPGEVTFTGDVDENVVALARSQGHARLVISSTPDNAAEHRRLLDLGFHRFHAREDLLDEDGRRIPVFVKDFGSTPVPRPDLVLAVELKEAHPAAAARSAFEAPHTVTSQLEAAGVTVLTIDDAPAGVGSHVVGPDAGVVAAALSTATQRIGLAPTLAVTTTEPFHVATELASLDWFSDGRGAWLVSAPSDAASLRTIGADPIDESVARLEARDVVEVSRRLWDSWQDDAWLTDIESSRFVDADRVHSVDFVGERFSVVGPLITPRPPQGQLVVIAPEELGLDVEADIVLITADDLDGIREAAGRVRAAGSALVFAEVEVAFDTPGGPADGRIAALGEWPRTGRLRHLGSIADFVGLLTELSGIVDGVRLHLAEHDDADLPVLTVEVIPELERAGLVRPPAEGATLRDSLGLTRPDNRYATPQEVLA